MITIKETTLKDLPFVRLLWNNGEVLKWAGFPEGLNQSQQDMILWFNGLKENEFHYSIYDEMSNYCGETFFRTLATHTQMDIKLMPEVQNKGIGAYALSFAMEQAFKKNPEAKLIVDPQNGNTKAHQLYLKLGYTLSTIQETPGHTNYECSLQQFKPYHYVTIRPIVESDLETIWQMTDKEEHYWWQDWDGPYFPKSQPLSLDEFKERYRTSYLNPDHKHLILDNGHPAGFLTAYYEDDKTRWLEMGIILFEEHKTSQGIGSKAIKLWQRYLFNHHPVERVGLTTWSGNIRMMKAAINCGMKLEARIRKVRYYQGIYYDSIKYGILRDEFNLMERWHVSIVHNEEEKRNISRSILHSLPQWFGIPEATQNYIDDSSQMVMAVIKEQDQALGFIALNPTSQNTLDIHVMGVLPQAHRQQVGSRLIQFSETYARQHHYQLLQVKTLDETHPDPNYQKTRIFYQKVGFLKLESFPELWDKQNPCLVMMKPL